MIDKSEIVAKSEEFDIHTSDVQRDYVFSWILAGIYAHTDIGKHLVLKGGNSLRKAYFEHARFSQDLDFTTQSSLLENFIVQELNKACDFVEATAGVVFLKERTTVADKRGVDSDKKVYEARLYFRDFFGNPQKIIISIRLDVTQFEKIFLPIQQRNLIHPYSDYNLCSIPVRCLKLEEILAGKLKCLLQRRHSVDLYDFIFSVLLNQGIDIDRSEIVSTFLQMTIFSLYPGVVKNLLIDLPFEIIRGLWHKYLVVPKRGVLDFTNAVESFKTIVDELFGNLPVRGGEYVFFPSHLRNPIMEAGYNMTCLEIVYHGVRRLVEPYSLVYKTRRDGVSREYLYVYDQTGGRSSGSGIKSFVHTDIENLQNTNQKFDPRFEVELCKAGEKLRSSYFARPVGRRSISSWEDQYTIECPYCEKRFKRNKYSTKLNPHKDKYGNRCFGRNGYVV
jgi:predicted nucleotidyltransferase component of viral defense system